MLRRLLEYEIALFWVILASTRNIALALVRKKSPRRQGGEGGVKLEPTTAVSEGFTNFVWGSKKDPG